ncbi:stalk domain-containing protein [Saccharibacillus kuerlensis]|uniref:Copper amine oxidase-like N-terminal domain-containing protein n=1 Tax=Saccharibacillus kuerlensis TaxID=459527 RepID=A0ABQ2L340_9BACL|nr:stalk domain-containing protein [Saccharibacillus kuerlensis]GGO00806.1 hypothetical protein GCM10010969_22430 [Saccharibacillus kuerlensis]
MKKMQKVSAALLAGALLLPAAVPYSADAATPIKVYIDGVELTTRQAPIMQGNRTLVPLRGIFEALNARVVWNQKAKTVSAYKGSDTVLLTIGSKSATVNGSSVTLDVPARVVNGSTVVPLRFISESLGQGVNWNATTKTVNITTTDEFEAPTSVTARNLGQFGDGRDLQVSFVKTEDESYVQQYRVFVVKSGSASAFNVSRAVSSRNYTPVMPNGSNQTFSLTAQAKDTDGQALRAGQPYQVFVAAVGNSYAAGKMELSPSSAAVTLSGAAVGTASSVKATDTADFGDGRDLTVSFARAQDESLLSGYRVMVVKTRDASSFNLLTANAVAAQNYTTVPKGSATPSVTLTAQSRDTSGELLRSGVPYTVFVLGTSSTNNASNNTLSNASASVTLAATGSDVSAANVAVSDIADYGDGRDLRVTFNRATNEALVSQYRVLVVKDSKASSFNINNANAVSSANYTAVNKTGANLTQTLSSNARDTDGDPIRNGVGYRVYVLTVGAGTSTSTNVLSASSQPITLASNYSVGAAATPVLSDAGDFGDGRDLLVTFGRAADESSLSEYRVLVVKSGSAPTFNLASAISVPAANYASIAKTGASQSQFLYSSTRDVNGEPIRSGVSYRVFILSVGSTNSSNTNANYALSGVSNAVTLSSNSAVSGASNVAASVSGTTGTASDIEVSFTRSSNEDNVAEYRILAVPADRAGAYSLADANAAYYSTPVSKAGSGQIRQALTNGSRDVFGGIITTGGKYRIYVLTVANSGSNTLSAPSAEVSLSEAAVQPAVGVGATVNGSVATVGFTRPSNTTGILEYRVMLVPASSAPNFTVANASSASTAYSKASTGTASFSLNSGDTDAFGGALQAGVSYRAFVLSIADGRQITANALSAASNDFILVNP